jgi:hypothetical protein
MPACTMGRLVSATMALQIICSFLENTARVSISAQVAGKKLQEMGKLDTLNSYVHQCPIPHYY